MGPSNCLQRMCRALSENRWTKNRVSSVLSTGTTSSKCPSADRLRRRMDKWMKSPPNFERLVLGCIDASDSENWRIFQHYFFEIHKISDFCTAQTSKFKQQLVRNVSKRTFNFQTFAFKNVQSCSSAMFQNVMHSFDDFLSEFRDTT